MSSDVETTAKRLLTERELADRHQRSVKTIQNDRVKGGGVPFIKVGRLVRYRLDDILAYEERARCSSTSTNMAGER